MAKKTPQVDSVEGFTLTPEEKAAVIKARETLGAPVETGGQISDTAVQAMASALITAIEATRPPTKKTVFTRKKGDPWQPADGSPKLKLKRKIYHHGIELFEKQLKNEQIALLNQIKPGAYCNRHVRVIKRRDGDLDIDYPIRTAAQRLKLVNQFKIVDFTALLQRIVDERADPKRYKAPDEDDD